MRPSNSRGPPRLLSLPPTSVPKMKSRRHFEARPPTFVVAVVVVESTVFVFGSQISSSRTARMWSLATNFHPLFRRVHFATSVYLTVHSFSRRSFLSRGRTYGERGRPALFIFHYQFPITTRGRGATRFFALVFLHGDKFLNDSHSPKPQRETPLYVADLIPVESARLINSLKNSYLLKRLRIVDRNSIIDGSPETIIWK